MSPGIWLALMRSLSGTGSNEHLNTHGGKRQMNQLKGAPSEVRWLSALCISLF